MHGERNVSQQHDDIARSIRAMREEPVPADFAARVMAALPPRRIPLRTRLRLWLTRPRSVTFTPLKAAPVVALAAILFCLALWPDGGPRPEVNGLAPVRFVLADARRTAHSVAVIGSFNNWRPTTAMHYDPAAGAWILEARLPAGEYEYVFQIDGGRLVPDPRAQASRGDGFGNTNSIVYVGGDHAHML